MPDDPHAIIEVCVEILRETPQAYGVMFSRHGFALIGERTPLVWLPKTEIVKLTRNTDGQAVVELPRWLAEKEGLIDTAEPADLNQEVLL